MGGKLCVLEEGEIDILPKEKFLELVRNKVKDNLHTSYEKNATVVRFLPGQEILRRNFVLSDASKRINSKLCKKFVKCRVIRQIGKSLYEVENLAGKKVGVYHAKDLQHMVPVK